MSTTVLSIYAMHRSLSLLNLLTYMFLAYFEIWWVRSVPLAFAPTTNTFKPKKLAVSSNLNNKEKGENSVNRVKYMYDTVSQKKRNTFKNNK